MLADEIKEMEKQGLGEDEIKRILFERGISPREIRQGLEQAGIKPAGGDEQMEGMQPSIMAQQIEQTAIPESMEGEGTFPIPQEPVQNYEYQAPGQNVQAEQYAGYPQYEYQAPGLGTEAVSEIAEQIVLEKIEDIKKKISGVSEFKAIAEGKIKNFSDRLDKIEANINNLQFAVLKRVGDYIQGVEDVKRELQMNQEVFSRILEPLTENIKKLEEISGGKGGKIQGRPESAKLKEEQAEQHEIVGTKEEKKEEMKTGKKKKQSFEAYLRR